MLDIRPFRALHYDPAAVSDLAAVLAPPYDVIDAAQRDRLYGRSPHNVVRLILNRAADPYAAAAAELADWRRRGVLVRDAEPSLYYYVQDFSLTDGTRHQRSGLLAAVRLEPFASGAIRPHERTFARAKADRMRLIEACRVNLSPIFGIYPDRRDALAPARAQSAAQAPWADVAGEGDERHRVWRLSDPATIAAVTNALGEATVFIADGHHRYETALEYRDRRRAAGATDPDAPHNFLLMYLCSMDDPGLVILPTHRIWKGAVEEGWLTRMGEQFEVEDFAADAGGERELFDRLNRETRPGCLGVRLASPARACLLRLRDMGSVDRAFPSLDSAVRHLDVTVLDAFLLGRLLGIDTGRAAQEGQLAYTHDERQALDAVDRGEAGASFLLRAPNVGEVEAACVAGQTMPQKSTYFFPKLQTGLVFHLLDADG